MVLDYTTKMLVHQNNLHFWNLHDNSDTDKSHQISSTTFLSKGKDDLKNALRKKCPYSELFWSVFFRIRTQYWEIRSISSHSVWMLENTDLNNSEQGHFLRRHVSNIAKSCPTEDISAICELHLLNFGVKIP